MKNTPKLRFKGFEGEWEEKTLGDICSFTKGKGYSKSDISEKGFPLFLYGRMYTNYSFSVNSVDTYASLKEDSYISEGNEVVIPASGETAQDIVRASAISASGIVLGGDLNILKFDLVKYSTPFIALSFSNGNLYDQLIKSAQGKTVVHLHNSEIQKGKILIPSLPEQRKLSSYFTHLDTLIESSRQKVEKLKQVKAASLQSFFPAHGQRTPNVRFKGCEGEWKVVKLNSFAKRVVRKNTHLESTLALTIASAHGLISQKDYFNNSVVGANIRNYYLLKKGEFAYNKSYSNGFPFGSVKRLDNYEQGILSTLYIVFSIDDSIDSDYLCHFFDTSLWHNDVAERATEGARNHGLLNIGAEDFLDIDIILPNSLPEQRKIASYFTHLDTLLTLERQRYEKLQQVKRASLSQMLV